MPTNYTLLSWKRSIQQLQLDADIVFFGDSITIGGDFQSRFDDYKIVNLGLSGDSVIGMSNRVDMIKNVKPEKVFIMGGINSLNNNNINDVIKQYEVLINRIQHEMPNTKIYIESVLPITKKQEERVVGNSTIVRFNKMLMELAEKKELIYIDLHSSYFRDGCLPDTLSKDGIHLKPEAYDIWFNAIEKYVKE